MNAPSSPMVFEAVEAFNQMVAETKSLVADIEVLDCEVYLPDFNPPVNGKVPSTIAETLLSLWHDSDGDGRSTLVFQGLVVAPQPVLDQVRAVNDAKARFHKLMGDVIKSKQETPNEVRQVISQHLAADREMLKYTGLARLNLNHCYRVIPYIERPILKAGFSWSHGELSINRITPEDAVKELMNLNRDMPTHIAIQIERASALPPGTHLAKVQVNTHRLKSNVVMEDVGPDGDRTFTRKTIRTSLPLFVLRGSATPEIVFRERPEQKPERLSRLDRKIEEEPFLPSIRAHLYKS